MLFTGCLSGRREFIRYQILRLLGAGLLARQELQLLPLASALLPAAQSPAPSSPVLNLLIWPRLQRRAQGTFPYLNLFDARCRYYGKQAEAFCLQWR